MAVGARARCECVCACARACVSSRRKLHNLVMAHLQPFPALPVGKPLVCPACNQNLVMQSLCRKGMYRI
eukprot:5593661-Amphidinium_carterae.2